VNRISARPVGGGRIDLGLKPLVAHSGYGFRARAFGAPGMTKGTSVMIRKLSSGKYRLYSRKMNPKTGKRRNLGTFGSRAAAEKHERDVQYFKRH
jgi:hypothetical protein